MGFKGNYDADQDGLVSETGNWNNAKEYSSSMIMEGITDAAKYQKIAKMGFISLLAQIENLHLSRDELRLQGMSWLIDTLRTTIENSYFAIKYNNHKTILDEYEKEIARAERLLPSTYNKVINAINNTSKIKINEHNFSLILEKLRELRKGILVILNKSDLIFVDKKEFDPIKHKASVINQLTERG